MSLEQAAAAFDADMGRNTSSLVKEPKAAPAEPLFTNLGSLEVDDDSPSQGGGDEYVEERPAPRREAKAPKKDEEEDEDLYADFTDEERVALGLPPREPDEEGDEEEDGEPDEDADDDEDELLAKEFTVMVDGEEQRVKLADALQNYTHRKAVDQRMQQVEEGRKAVVSEAQNVIKLRQQVDSQLAEAEEILKALIPAEPNWDELFVKDPKAARELQKQYEMFQEQIKTIQAKRKKNAEEAEQSDIDSTVNYRNVEAKKFAQIAKWDSAKSRDKDLASMTKTALSAGFSQKEVVQVLDSRMLHVLLKASKYDRMMAARPKPTNVRQQQKPGNPGAQGNRRPAPKGNDRAMKTLQRTGSVEAAASVFEGILKRSN